MNYKEQQRITQENSYAIENLEAMQKNKLIWELDKVLDIDRQFDFYHGGGKVEIELFVIGQVEGNIVIDNDIFAVDRSFKFWELSKKRGKQKIVLSLTGQTHGGKLEIMAYGAKKLTVASE